jgi:aspartate racemase
MTVAKHIGIVACSYEGAALCYRTICLEAQEQMGEDNHPEVTMHTHSLAEYMAGIRPGDWEKVAELMLDSTRKLAAAGAEFAICPDNTIHEAFELVERRSPLPWLHIARVVAQEAHRRGFRRLGVLGTAYLMEGPVYPRALEPMGIEVLIPSERDRKSINGVIFDELVRGRLLEASRAYLNKVMGELKARGADAAVLGCTEIPLIVRADHAPLPTLDSARLLARAAVCTAIA